MHGKLINRFHWCVEEYTSYDKTEDNFVDRFYFNTVEQISEKYKCARMSVYYYLTHNNKSKKLGHLKILRINVHRKAEVDNPILI